MRTDARVRRRDLAVQLYIAIVVSTVMETVDADALADDAQKRKLLTEPLPGCVRQGGFR
jgi:hypothetical protein